MQKKNISRFGFEQCQKCAICETVCPMQEVNPQYPGPKQAGPDGERYRLKSPIFFDYALKYCLNCKRCEVACPSGVEVADLIAAAKMKYGKNSNGLRNRMLANTDLIGSIASPFAPIVNGAFSLKTVRKLADCTIKIDSRRSFPKYSREKFVDWYDDNKESQKGFNRYVTYFHGCYVNYNYPALGKAAVGLLNACGYGVDLMRKEKCCGVALIANNFGVKAVGNARINVKAMKGALNSGSSAILSTSSSCVYTMREEYPRLLSVDNSEVVSSLMLVTRFIYEEIRKGKIKLVFREDWKGHYAYHTACHMQRLGWQLYSIELLKMIPGMTLDIIEQNCCGIAGTFGFKKENFDYSQKIGRKLFSSICATGAEAVATDCETCKWQIEMNTHLPVFNPVEILFSAIDIDKTKAANS